MLTSTTKGPLIIYVSGGRLKSRGGGGHVNFNVASRGGGVM